MMKKSQRQAPIRVSVEDVAGGRGKGEGGRGKEHFTGFTKRRRIKENFQCLKRDNLAKKYACCYSPQHIVFGKLFHR